MKEPKRQVFLYIAEICDGFGLPLQHDEQQETLGAHRMRMVKLFDDPTPDGIINQRFVQQQIVIAKATDFSDAEAHLFLRILIFVAKKLAFVWKHKLAFQNLERKLVAELTAKGGRGEYRKGKMRRRICSWNSTAFSSR